MSYRKTKRDGNHEPILDALKATGAEVVDCSAAGSVPDLLVSYRGRIGWIEVKVAVHGTRYTAKQLQWIANTKMPVAFVTTEKDAVDHLTRFNLDLTQGQKDALAGLLVTNPTKVLFTPKQIREVLAI